MIYNTNPEFNPDYPQSNGAGFEQYCYQQAMPSMEYYYAGGNNVFQMPTSNADPFSRRNQPVVPQAAPQNPFVQPQSTPQAPAAGWGFNQLAESRRTMGPAPQVPQAPAFGMSAPTQPQVNVNPWAQLPQFDGFSMQPMSYAPPVPQFDQACINAAQQHRGLFYEQPQYTPCAQPNIDWGKGNNTFNMSQPRYQPVDFPPMAQQQTTMSWLDQVRSNFSMK